MKLKPLLYAGLLALLSLSIKPNISFGQTYCIPPATQYSSICYITNVTTTGGSTNINNSSAGPLTGGYSDYTSHSIQIKPGQTFNFSVTTNYTVCTVIWVDWNDDGDFQDRDEKVFVTPNPPGWVSPTTGSITVPTWVTPGTTCRIRIRTSYAVNPFPLSPCIAPAVAGGLDMYNGETEDYNIDVIGDPCSSASIPAPTAFADRDTVLKGGRVMLDIDANLNTIADLSYQWQESPNGTSNWTNIGSANDHSYLITNDIIATTYYRCKVLCSNSEKVTSSTVQVYVKSLFVKIPSDTGRCGPGTVTFTAQAVSGATIHWYASDTSTTPLATGPVFTTPSISNNVTYYASATYDLKKVFDTLHGSNDGVVICQPTTPGGVIFDITPNRKVKIDGFAGLADWSNSSPISLSGPVKIYYKNGTYVGSITTPAAWTLATTLNMTYNAGTVISMPLSSPIPLNGNTTYGFYLQYHAGGRGVSTTPSNRDLLEENGYMSCTAFSNANPNSSFTGSIFYHTGGTTESARIPVTAHIAQKPDVDLGPDMNTCINQGGSVILDPGPQPSGTTFKWDDNSTSRFRSVNQSGTYWVIVDMFGCSNADTINVQIRLKPKVNIGNDTSVCKGTKLVLDAGPNGTQYFWNTGSTQRTTTVTHTGDYSVSVTAANGCIGVDTIHVDMSGNAPHYDNIIIDNNGIRTFLFNAYNPTHVVGYDWDFGDGSPHSNANVPTHTYAQNGNYIVTLTVASLCGYYTDSLSAHILGINHLQVDKNQLSIYPNPTKDKATIVAKDLKMKKVIVYNVLGQKIFETPTDNPQKHVIDFSGFANGVYTVSIYTDKGMVVRKLSVKR